MSQLGSGSNGAVPRRGVISLIWIHYPGLKCASTFRKGPLCEVRIIQTGGIWRKVKEGGPTLSILMKKGSRQGAGRKENLKEKKNLTGYVSRVSPGKRRTEKKLTGT